MATFSSRTLEFLHALGWYENRKIDTTKYVALFETTEQTYSQTVIKFLEEFGDIYFNFPKRIEKSPSYFYIDPLEAFTEMTTWAIQRYEKKLDTKLCLVGNVETTSILITPEGVAYSVFDNYISVIGNSGVETIEWLCEGL